MENNDLLSLLPKNVICKIMRYTGNGDNKKCIQEFVKLRRVSKKIKELVDGKLAFFCHLVMGDKITTWEKNLTVQKKFNSVKRWRPNEEPSSDISKQDKLCFENRLTVFSHSEVINPYCMPGAETSHRRDEIDYHYRDGFLVIVEPKKEQIIIDFRSKEGFLKGHAPTENFKFSSVVDSGVYVAVYGYDNGEAVLFLKKREAEKFEKHVIDGLEDIINERDEGFRTRVTFAENGVFVKELCQGNNVWIAQILNVEETASSVSSKDKEAYRYEVSLNKSFHTEDGFQIDPRLSGLNATKRDPLRVFCISNPAEKTFYFVNNCGYCRYIKADWTVVFNKTTEEVVNGFCDEFGKLHLLICDKVKIPTYSIYSLKQVDNRNTKLVRLPLDEDLEIKNRYQYENPILTQKLFDGKFVVIDQRKNEPSRLLCVVPEVKPIKPLWGITGVTHEISGGDIPFGHRNSGSVSDGSSPEKLVTPRLNDEIGFGKDDSFRTVSLSNESTETVNEITLPSRPQSLSDKVNGAFWRAIGGVAHLFVRFCQITAMVIVSKMVGGMALTILLSTGPLLFCVTPAAFLFYAVVLR